MTPQGKSVTVYRLTYEQPSQSGTLHRGEEEQHHGQLDSNQQPCKFMLQCSIIELRHILLHVGGVQIRCPAAFSCWKFLDAWNDFRIYPGQDTSFGPLSEKYFFPDQTLTLTVPSSVRTGRMSKCQGPNLFYSSSALCRCNLLAGVFFCEKSYPLWQFESQSLDCNFQSSLTQTLGVAATERCGLWLSNEQA